MPTLPDDKPLPPAQFENYLRLFDPLPPEGLRLTHTRTHRLPKPLLLWAALAAVVISAALMFYARSQGTIPLGHPASVAAAPDRSTRPLTLQSANALLNHAPSFKEAVDGLGSPSYETTLTREQSAFSALGKEAKL